METELLEEMLVEVEGKLSHNSSDTWIWKWDSSGGFDVKSAYAYLSGPVRKEPKSSTFGHSVGTSLEV